MLETKSFIISAVIAITLPIASPALVAKTPELAVSESLSYADVADLVIASPFVIKAQIKSIKKVSIHAADAQSAPQNYLYVTASVSTLIRGAGGIAPLVSFLVEQPAEPTAPALKWRRKDMVMLFAKLGTRPGEVQLVSRYAMRPATERLETLARDIAADLLKPNTPPTIVGVGDAFYSAGTVAGEGETQIFLKTGNGAPVSLSVVHRPGQATRWGVSLGEIVDEAAVPPARDTLLWYRLTCALPSRLPDASTRTLALTDAEAARRDYRFVLESLGSCGRTL